MSMESAISQALIAHHKHVNERWAQTPIGATLCVHDTITSTPDSAANNMKLTFVVESHIMLPGDASCTVKYRKIEYGPKGPNDSD